jgi:RecA/RadA recombinase
MLTGLGENTVGPGLEKAPAGISGLNQVTGGGLPRGRMPLVAGAAGAGKTQCERRQVAGTEADRVTMASRRWADVAPDSDVVPGNGGKK